MSEGSNVERRLCVTWETERPRLDFPRQSSQFSYMGCCCYLRSTLSHSGYAITVHEVKPGEQLDTTFYIGTFVIGKYPQFCVSDFSKTRLSGNLCIWSCTPKRVREHLGLDEDHGKWTIYCIFRSDQPTGLQTNNNETAHLTNSPEDSPSDLESLSLDFGNLLEEKSSPDVMLRCGSRTFSAHRLILSARSQVFSAMFRNKMAESETGTVDIADMNDDVLDVLLKYVYSGKMPDLTDDTASSLYSAADKYSIHALKKACSNWMVGRLSRENCLDFLLLADVYSDESFRDRVVTFVAGVLESLEEKAWSKFDDDHPILANSVYRRRYAARPKSGPNP